MEAVTDAVFNAPRLSSATRALDDGFRDQIGVLYRTQCVTEPSDPEQFRKGIAKAIYTYDQCYRVALEMLAEAAT